MNVLDLFSGIGGFSLGLERAGMTTVAFCEVDAAARRVLNKHWPTVPIYEDVKTLTKDRLDADGIAVDLICGGFPCQDISIAGRGAGLAGERSGLWFEFHRLIDELRPQWIIAENVSALRSRGLDTVLRSLAEIGYDAEWHCIPASAVGAPHQRDRIWIVAYPNRRVAADGRERAVSSQQGDGRGTRPDGSPEDDRQGRVRGAGKSTSDGLADTGGEGLSRSERLRNYLEENFGRKTGANGPTSERCPVSGGTLYSWHSEPAVGRVADGVPGRVDRLKQLGNAVVPQIPELLGRAIMEAAK